MSEKVTVVFLSTHFWDEVKAGGSLSHINGFTDGLIKLGHKVDLIAYDTPIGMNKDVSRHLIKKPSIHNVSKIAATLY